MVLISFPLQRDKQPHARMHANLYMRPHATRLISVKVEVDRIMMGIGIWI